MSEKQFTMKGSIILENGEEITAWDCCDLLNEQQAIIEQLQDLCGQSDGENVKLRIENKYLKSQLNKIPKSIRSVWLED